MEYKNFVIQNDGIYYLREGAIKVFKSYREGLKILKSDASINLMISEIEEVEIWCDTIDDIRANFSKKGQSALEVKATTHVEFCKLIVKAIEHRGDIPQELEKINILEENNDEIDYTNAEILE